MRLPSPVFSYPIANTNAPKISQTVLLMNPESAHFSASAGNLNAGSPRCNGEKTSPNAPPTVTAIKPIDAGGNGSVISARIVATNSARYRHANGARPDGGGRSASVTPTPRGTAVRHSRVRP